jgi:hypothetical protein
MRLSQPGTQLKEVFLPAPIVSFATGLGHGVNVEAYVQAKYNDNYFPPTGSYWSVFNGLGKGDASYGISKRKPKDGNQYGAAVRWQPEGTQLNLGLYAMSYQDKAPQINFSNLLAGTGGPEWEFAETGRCMVSAPTSARHWAIGTSKGRCIANRTATGLHFVRVMATLLVDEKNSVAPDRHTEHDMVIMAAS